MLHHLRQASIIALPLTSINDLFRVLIAVLLATLNRLKPSLRHHLMDRQSEFRIRSQHAQKQASECRRSDVFVHKVDIGVVGLGDFGSRRVLGFPRLPLALHVVVRSGIVRVEVFGFLPDGSAENDVEHHDRAGPDVEAAGVIFL